MDLSNAFIFEKICQFMKPKIMKRPTIFLTAYCNIFYQKVGYLVEKFESLAEGGDLCFGEVVV